MTLDAPEPIAAYLAAEERRSGRAFPLLHRRRHCPRRGRDIAVVSDPPMEAAADENTDTFCRWSTRKRMETR